MNNLEKAYYQELKNSLKSASERKTLVFEEGHLYDELEVYYENEDELRSKLGSELLYKLGNWSHRGIVTFRKSNIPTLPPSTTIALTPPDVKETIEKIARKTWSTLRKVPWGKIATILLKSIAIGIKHLGLTAKEITQTVVEEVRKKPEREQASILLTVDSLIKARIAGKISEKEYLETIKAIANQLGGQVPRIV